MERVKCSANPAHFASFYCECEAQQVNLCVSCLDEHLEVAKTHKVVRISTNPCAALPSDLCSICHNNHSTDLCICHLPVSPLCPLCRILHMSKEPSAAHRFLPIALKEGLRSEEDLMIVKHRLGIIDAAEGKLRQNVVEIANCEKKLGEKGRVAIETIRQYRENLLQQISDKRQSGELGAALQITDELPVINWEDILGFSWETRWTTCSALLPPFHLPHKDHILAEATKAAETMLAAGTVEQYLEAVERGIRERKADIAGEDMERYRSQAMVQYYKEHLVCAQAMDSAWGGYDGKQATSLYQTQVKLRPDSVAAFYQAKLANIMAANETLQVKLATLRAKMNKYSAGLGENRDMSSHKSRGKHRSHRSRSRAGRNFAGSKSVSEFPTEPATHLEAQLPSSCPAAPPLETTTVQSQKSTSSDVVQNPS